MALLENISAVGVGQTYTTMTSWEAAKRGDLTAIAHLGYDGYVEVAEIYGGGVLNTADLGIGWTTDATHYIQVRSASGQSHEGYFSTGKACLTTAIWYLNVGYTKVGPGLNIQGSMIYSGSGLGSLTIDGCIFKTIGYNGYGIIYLIPGGTHMIKNCIIETVVSTNAPNSLPTIASLTSGTQLYLYNCTIINNLNASASGISASTGVTVTSQNNYFNVPSGRTYMGAGTINKGANDATSNTDAVTPSLRSIAYSTSNFINVMLDRTDLHLSNTSALRGQGATLAAVPTDYVGNTRTGYTYDIGAHQRNTSGSDIKTLYENVSAVGVGRTYTTIALWQTAKVSNLVAKSHPGYDGYIEVAEIYGGGALTATDLDSKWITDQYHYIHIRAASGQGHEGYYSTGKACLSAGNWQVNPGYTKIGPGLSIQGRIPILSEGAGNLTIDGCIFQCTIYIAGDFRYGAIDFRCVGMNTVKNCTIEITNPASYCPAIKAETSGSQLCVYNCTIINNLHASDSSIEAFVGINVTSQNNYFHTPSGRTYIGAATYNKGANDATSNADATTPSLRNIAYSTSNFINITLGRTDFHLSNASALRGQGATLAAVPTDYVGNTRTGYTYDIGAHQRNTSGSDVKTFYENISAVGVGKTYTTIALWQTAKADNLVTKSHPGYDGYIEVAEIYGGGVLTAIDLGSTGWIVDQYHNIQVRAASGQGHEGYYSTSKACLNAGSHMPVNVGYIKIGPGLSIQGGIPINNFGGLGNLTMDGCIFQCTILDPAYGAIYLRTGGLHVIQNCTIEITNPASYCPAIKAETSGSQLCVYNCTIINNLHASDSSIEAFVGINVTSQNNYFHTPSGRTYIGAATYNKGANDATSNADATTPSLRNIAYSTSNFTNVTLNSEDLHLTNTSALRTKGADLSSLGITTDYEGSARRPGFLWDIGADQQSDIPFCWNYTAQYKNSTKLFKASGCGSFPKNLKVPSNIDISTGRMVDDGILINPDEYRII